jgi:hypothetical protein
MEMNTEIHGDLFVRAKRVCKRCGGGMEGKKASALFCSKYCNQAAWRKANPEKKAEINRKYYRSNVKMCLEWMREWRKANPEKTAEYAREKYKRNPEKCLERLREWRNNQYAAASILSLAHTVSQFTADPPNRNVTPAQDKTP